MAFTNPSHRTARFVKRPTGFTSYRGGGCPVSEDTYVETLHTTDEGYAIGPAAKAKAPTLHWWTGKKPVHAIVGWRLPAEYVPPPSAADFVAQHMREQGEDAPTPEA